MAKKNSSILWTVDQTGDVIGKDGREKAQKNVGLGSEFVKTSKTDKNYVTHVTRESNGELKVNVAQPSLSDLQGLGSGDKNKSIVTNNDGNIVAVALSAEQIDQTSTHTDINFVSGVTEDGNGKIHVTTKKITTATESTAGITTLKSDIFYENTKDKSTNVSVTPAGVWDAIESLDVSGITGFGAGKTLASLTETDGKIAATFQDIAVGGSAITLGTASVAVVTDSSKHLSTQDLSVSSPSASGNTNAFIDTISQSATGKISVTKKTLSVATSSNVGGVKSTTTGTTANRDYSVEVKSDGTMKVNVPWENTHYASKTVICKTSSGTANAEVAASDTAYMNHVENGSVVSSHKIIGDGFKVTSDSNGHLTLTSQITERSGKYSLEGHYPIIWSQDSAGDQRLYADYQHDGETVWTGYLVPSPVNHQGDILMYKNNVIAWVTPDPVTVTTYSDVRESSSYSTGLKATSMELITGTRSSLSYNMHLQYNDGSNHIKDAYFPIWGLKNHSDVQFEYTHEPRVSLNYDGTPYSVNTSARFDDIADIYYSNTTSGYVFKEGDVFFAPIDTGNYNERHQLVYVKKDISLTSRSIPEWFNGADASEYFVKNRLFELFNNGRNTRQIDKSRAVSIMEHFIDYWTDRSITDGNAGYTRTYPIKSVSVTATNDYGQLTVNSRTITAPSPSGGGSADYNTSASYYLLNTRQGEDKQYGFVYMESGSGAVKHLTVKQLPLPRSLGGTYTVSASDGSVVVGSYYTHKVTITGNASAQYIYIDNNGKSGYYWRYSDSGSAATHGQISGDRQPFSLGHSDYTNHVKMEIYCNYSDAMVHVVVMPEVYNGSDYTLSVKVEWLVSHE